MNTFKFYNIFLLALLLISCGKETTKENKPQLLVVDLMADPDKKVVNDFLNRMKIRLMPLETGDDLLFNGKNSHLYVYKNELFVADGGQNIIFRYDHSGKLINKINRLGQGPEEYIYLGNIAFANDLLYVRDKAKLQVYDFEGKYVRTIPIVANGDIAVREDGAIVALSNYKNPYQVTVYDENGNKIYEGAPSLEKLKQFKYSRSNYYTLRKSETGKGYYFTNYFDSHIYLLEDTVRVFATLDFKEKSIPADYLSGTINEISKNWEKDQSNDKFIFELSDLIITKDWITFCPPLREPKIGVYYDRKNDICITNKAFEGIYNVLLGGYDVPDGFNFSSEEFYKLVNTAALKEAITELAQDDPNYQENYPFLKGIDYQTIDEEANDWVMFFSLN